jgi:hypothetical protein
MARVVAWGLACTIESIPQSSACIQRPHKGHIQRYQTLYNSSVLGKTYTQQCEDRACEIEGPNQAPDHSRQDLINRAVNLQELQNPRPLEREPAIACHRQKLCAAPLAAS